MQIFVKDPAGKTVTIDDVMPSDTIATVLDQFERKTQMRARTNMRYVYRGRPLDIDKPLDHYGIGRTDTIHCYLAPVSSCDTRVRGVNPWNVRSANVTAVRQQSSQTPSQTETPSRPSWRETSGRTSGTESYCFGDVTRSLVRGGVSSLFS